MFIICLQNIKRLYTNFFCEFDIIITETKKDKKQAVGRVGKVFRERRNYQYDS